MKRTFKYALLATAAAFALGVAMPSQAQQQDEMQTTRTMKQQRVYQQNQADRYAAQRAYDAETSGTEAYGYVPLPSQGSGDPCEYQGNYGTGIDYQLCGGGD